MKMKKKMKQYGILVVGLLIAGGFAFGGMASYSNMVNTQSSNDQQDQFNATLPSETFSTSGYGLSQTEQRVLAARNDVAFVNLLYDSPESYSQLQELEGIQTQFRGRMFIQLVNESTTSAYAQYGFTSYPRGVVIGGNRGNSAIQLLQDPSEGSIIAASCSSLASWNPGNGPSVADICSQ